MDKIEKIIIKTQKSRIFKILKAISSHEIFDFKNDKFLLNLI